MRKYRIFFQSRFFLFFELGWKRVPGSLIIYFSSKKKIVRAITRGYGTAAKYLSIFVERWLFHEVLKIESRIQETTEMLNFIDYVNNNCNILTEDSILISFGLANMFPIMNNQSGFRAVKDGLDAMLDRDNFHLTNCIMEALVYWHWYWQQWPSNYRVYVTW